MIPQLSWGAALVLQLLTAPPAAASQPPPSTAPAPAAAPAQKRGNAATSRAEKKKGTRGSPASVARKKVQEGDRLLREKRFREASFAFQEAVNADPDNLEALFKLGNAYAVLGYFPQAIERWTLVAQRSPDPAVRRNAQDNITKARAKMAPEDGASPLPSSAPAADTAARVNEQAQQKARAAYEEGVARVKQRDYAGSLPHLNKAIQLDPTFEVAHVARGSANIGLRRYVEAASDYETALKLKPESATPLYGLAEAYRGMGRLTEARELYERYAASTASDVRPELVTDAKAKAQRLQ